MTGRLFRVHYIVKGKNGLSRRHYSYWLLFLQKPSSRSETYSTLLFGPGTICCLRAQEVQVTKVRAG
jgi:hypothetical protein